MPTLGALSKERLSRALNDASTQLYTSARRIEAINDAQEEFADLTECLIRQVSVPCSCNVTEYSLLSVVGSSDFSRLAPQGVEYLHTSSNGYVTQLAGDDFLERPIQFQNRVSPGWRGSTTPILTPSGWYRRQDGGDLRIGLYEPPKIGSSETAVLQVPYVQRATAMTSTTAEPFTVNSTVRTDLRLYHRALPHYAASQLLPLVGDAQGAAAQLQVFMGYVSRYLSQQRPKGGQTVTFATNYLQRARGDRSGVSLVPGWPWR